MVHRNELVRAKNLVGHGKGANYLEAPECLGRWRLGAERRHRSTQTCPRGARRRGPGGWDCLVEL